MTASYAARFPPHKAKKKIAYIVGCVMAFVLPTFNITFQAVPNFNFNLGLNPAAGFILIGTPCNLTNTRRNHVDAVTVVTQAMYLLFPAGVALKGRDSYAVKNGDAVEVPMGSGRWYSTVGVDDVASGFANAHRQALIVHPYPLFATPPLWP